MKHAETAITIRVLQSRHDKKEGKMVVFLSLLRLPEHQPRGDALPFLMRVVVRRSDVVALSVDRAIEALLTYSTRSRSSTTAMVSSRA